MVATVAEPPEVTTYRFTRQDYHRMADVGVFEGRCVELLDGEVIEMAPQNAPHAYAVMVLAELITGRLDASHVLRTQLPLALGESSEPEPDAAICKRSSAYASRHPEPADVVLVVEVSESTLRFDRGLKARSYARAGIPEYWIVDLQGRQVEVFCEPDPGTGRYRQQRAASPGDALTLPGGETLGVDEILPPTNA